MNKYEMLFIIENRLDDEQKGLVVEKMKSIVTSNGGNILNENIWGAKKFAYPINDQREGYYVCVDFESSGEVPKEIERQVRNTKDIYRVMIIKKDCKKVEDK